MEEVVRHSFFLCDECLDNARYLISEAYCRIHQKIDIVNLSQRLNLSQEEGEKWIVNLIKGTRMGADVKLNLEKVSFASTFFALQLPLGSFFTFLSFLCSFILIPHFPIRPSSNKPTSPAADLPKCHRKDPTTPCTHTSPGCCHRTFRPRCLHGTAQPRPTRAGGHCQEIRFCVGLDWYFPFGCSHEQSTGSLSMLFFNVACSYQSFSKFVKRTRTTILIEAS